MENEEYIRLKELCEKNISDLDMAKIEKAYIFATESHKGQYRKSGEEYIIHPIEVSIILAGLKMDTDTIVAGLLHDVVEDTLITLADIEYEFGSDVALLVDGVTKLRNLPKTKGKQIENIRKMVVAMSKDIRVVIIKLADRLHNMRTIQFQSNEKQIEKAKECIEIFAPIAHRIGMSKIKSELEDISFRILDPESYFKMAKNVDAKLHERLEITDKIINDITIHINNYKINAQISGRPKHLYSIYKKITEKNKKFADLMDLIAIRVIVEKEEECYIVLGIIHSIFTPVDGRFKDYIAVPKNNGYQSIHTTIEYDSNQKVEVQIRTKQMHQIAEEGVAAHWKYKEHKNKDKNEKYYQSIKKMLSNNDGFAREITGEVLNTTIFVFTPKGDVVELQRGSTTLDFAFHIHSQIGYRTIGAKVNSKIAPLDYVLETGDTVEIITSKTAKGPGKDWINMVTNQGSKNKIRKWFKDLEYDEKSKYGEQLVYQEFAKNGLKFEELKDDEIIYLYMKKYNVQNLTMLFYKFAVGDVNIDTFVQKFIKEKPQDVSEIIEEIENKANKIPKKNIEKSGVKITGSDNTLFHFAKCCSPLPGDQITGYVTRGRGIVIHTSECKNIIDLISKEKEREIDVYWDENLIKESTYRYEYSFVVSSLNRESLLLDIIRIINEHKLDISLMNSVVKYELGQEIAYINLRILIKNKDEYYRLRKNLLSMKDIIDVK